MPARVGVELPDETRDERTPSLVIGDRRAVAPFPARGGAVRATVGRKVIRDIIKDDRDVAGLVTGLEVGRQAVGEPLVMGGPFLGCSIELDEIQGIPCCVIVVQLKPFQAVPPSARTMEMRSTNGTSIALAVFRR